jgi:hypothetical protein
MISWRAKPAQTWLTMPASDRAFTSHPGLRICFPI